MADWETQMDTAAAQLSKRSNHPASTAPDQPQDTPSSEAWPWHERAFAIHVDNSASFPLFAACEINSLTAFRNHVGLSSSNTESRDVFNKSLITNATAVTVGGLGGGDETITLLHYLCCLSNPVRTDIITLCAQADPSLLYRPSSHNKETPAHFAVACGNLPALHVLLQLSEKLLDNKMQVLLPASQLHPSPRGSPAVPLVFSSTVAHIAAAHDKVLILAYLTQAAPDLLCRPDSHGLTPLHVAAKCYSERSLLYLAKWFASKKSDESLFEQLCRKDKKGLPVFTLIRRYWKNDIFIIALDLAKYVYQQARTRSSSSSSEDTTDVGVRHRQHEQDMTRFWSEMGLLAWHQRSTRFCSQWCVRKIWTRGRTTQMHLPFACVLLAIALSFVGVFVWPKTYSAMYQGYSFRFLHWGVSTVILLGTLVKMHVQGTQPCGGDGDLYIQEVMDRPDDHSGIVVEETVRATTVHSARTLYSEALCPFCEIRRDRSKLNVPTEHCFTCGTCVAGLDHHCPWTGTCVGQHNVWMFRLFLMATLSTVIAYIRLYSAFRQPDCNRRLIHSGGNSWWDGAVGCVFSGSLMHSVLLVFVYVSETVKQQVSFGSCVLFFVVRCGHQF